MPNLTLASGNDTFKLYMLEFTSWMVWLKWDLWQFQTCFVKYMCGVYRKIAASSLFNPCYSGIWRWHICTIHFIVHLKIGLNNVRHLTQYFCFVLDVQGKSAQKLLVEDKFQILLWHLQMTNYGIELLEFWTFDFV